MADKWYNSDFGKYTGIGILFLGFGTGIGSCVRWLAEADVELAKARRGPPSKIEYRLQEADLNGNNIPEKFYTIDGKIALVELDGKPVSELYKK